MKREEAEHRCGSPATFENPPLSETIDFSSHREALRIISPFGRRVVKDPLVREESCIGERNVTSGPERGSAVSDERMHWKLNKIDKSMLSKLIFKAKYISLKPGGPGYHVAFLTSRLLVRLGLLVCDTRIEYVERQDFLLVLTPLAGSSSIRAQVSDIKRFDLRETSVVPEKRLLIMDRSYETRMRSFYNKKVRNPTNLAKTKLLATCRSLTYSTTPEEFVRYVLSIRDQTVKDKHLYTTEQICTALGRSMQGVELVNIEDDRAALESMLGISLVHVVNSSDNAATYAVPLDLPSFDTVATEGLTQ